MSIAMQIEQLKESWKADPFWDIEDTEGFEAFRDELRDFRLQFEAEMKERRIQMLQQKAERLGCPNNLALAQYVEMLELNMAELEARVANLEGQ